MKEIDFNVNRTVISAIKQLPQNNEEDFRFFEVLRCLQIISSFPVDKIESLEHDAIVKNVKVRIPGGNTIVLEDLQLIKRLNSYGNSKEEFVYEARINDYKNMKDGNFAYRLFFFIVKDLCCDIDVKEFNSSSKIEDFACYTYALDKSCLDTYNANSKTNDFGKQTHERHLSLKNKISEQTIPKHECILKATAYIEAQFFNKVKFNLLNRNNYNSDQLFFR